MALFKYVYYYYYYYYIRLYVELSSFSDSALHCAVTHVLIIRNLSAAFDDFVSLVGDAKDHNSDDHCYDSGCPLHIHTMHTTHIAVKILDVRKHRRGGEGARTGDPLPLKSSHAGVAPPKKSWSKSCILVCFK